MQVPQLDIHSHKRRNSIFEKERYSPERDITSRQRMTDRFSKVDKIVAQKYIREEKVHRGRLISTLPEPVVPLIQQIPVPVPVPVAVPYTYPGPETVPRSERKRFSYLPQTMDPPYEEIENDLLIRNHLPPPLPPPLPPYIHNPYIPPPPILPSITPPLPPPHLLMPQPPLIYDDVSSYLTSPIIHQAPSTYFQLSQRILNGSMPRPFHSSYSILRQREYSLKNHLRQSPTRDNVSRVNIKGDCSCQDKKPSTKGVGSLSKNVYIKQNQNTSNIAENPSIGLDVINWIGGSNVSFGGNNNNKKPQPSPNLNPNPNPTPIPNINIIQPNSNQSNDDPIPNQIYQIFHHILRQQKIQPPARYSSQWEQIIKQCQNLSKQQRTKLIRQRLRIWKKVRQTITQQTIDINNQIALEALRKIQYDNLVYQEKMKALMNQIKQFDQKTQEIITFKSKKPDLDDLSKVKDDYVQSTNQQLHKIDHLIKEAQERINPPAEVVQTFTYFN